MRYNNSEAAAGAETRAAEGNRPFKASYDQIADYLTDGFWEWSGGSRSAFDVEPGGTLTVDITGLAAAGQQLARWALEAWSNVTGINFEFVGGDSAQITFDDRGGDANAVFFTWGNRIISSQVNVGEGWLDVYGTTIDGYSFQTYLHEIGHALGLGHAGPYSSIASYGSDNLFLNDSWQATVESYFSQVENTHINADFAYAVTPMIADIIAVQNLYGAPADIRGGDTVYGYNSNLDGYLGQLFSRWTGDAFREPVALTLYDTGGIDVLDLRTDTSAQRVDLRPAGISDVYGLVGNLMIAQDTLIEHFIAGSGNDRVFGNAAANRLEGRGGADELRGEGGDDVLEGGAGADRLYGGPGVDVVSYAESGAAVTVSLATDTVSGGHAEGDEISGFENVEGSRYGDLLSGDSGGNRLFGLGGNDELQGEGGDDVLAGGAGADRLDGGPGVDMVSYAGSDGAVTVSLALATASDGDAEGDEISGFENVEGSRYGDLLSGDSGSNRLFGGGGDDVLVGGAGADVLDGGSGVDTASYEGSDEVVWVNLTTGAARRGHARGDVLTDIENLAGTRYADRLVGDGGANRLSGGVGNDRLSGLSGDDVLVGGAGADRLEGGPGVDTASYEGSDEVVWVNLTTGAARRGHARGDVLTDIENLAGTRYADRLVGDGGANRLSGGVGNDRLSGLSGDDVLVGGAGADRLEGGPGVDDVLDGGSGVDTASYEGSDEEVWVNLTTGAARRGHAQGDVLTDIENLAGTRYADRLVGDGGANRLSGGVGNDRLTGLSGDDVLVGGAGADRLEGGPGVDTASYEGSDEEVWVNLTTGAARRGHARGDVLTDIENLAGTRYADRLVGDGGANRLSGGVGNDRLSGLSGDDVLVGGAGTDRLEGGPGVDTVSYEGSDEEVWVNLTTGAARRGHARGDALTDIENLAGTRYEDRLVGDGGANRLSGGVGNDRLTGLSGDDVLVGGAGADRLEGGPGVDTVSYEGSDEEVWVNLTTGAARRGHARGDVLTDIENLAGTRFWDRLVGDGGANRLSGGVGNDRLSGLGGDDVLVGGAGADRLEGGPGVDTVSYEGSDGSVAVNLTTDTALRAHAEGDELTDIENLAGTRFWDRLVGDGGANRLSGDVGNDRLSGLGGDDVLVGGAGADRLEGGPGVDTVSYEGSDGSVAVNLTTDTALRAHAEGDELTDIENLAGTRFWDRLVGDGGANRLSGGVGNDRLSGLSGDDVLVGGAGADVLEGGPGVDTVSYEGSDGSVAVNLTTDTALRAHAEGDELVDIENLEGTRFWDRLVGDGGANRLSGGVGNDRLSGLSGDDVLVGGAGADVLEGGPGVDTVSYEGSDGSVAVNLTTDTALRAHAEGDVLVDIENLAGTRFWDRLVGDGGANRLSGGVGNDRLSGLSGDDVLVGGAGADVLDGGPGVDTVSYEGSDGSVAVDLTTGTALRAHAVGDELVDIENLIGTRFWDRLTGDGGANWLSGGVGNDRLTGLGGDDVLVGGAGADVLDGGPGVDTVSYEGSDGSVTVDLATGTALRAHAVGDVLVDIENLAGTRFWDRLTGDGGANRLSGGVGNDRLSGGVGNDVLVGGAGADVLDGGPGVDTVSYEGSDGSVAVDLTTGTALRAHAVGDVLVDIENLEGTRFWDRLTGDGGANRLSGSVGNDRLFGGGGNDVLVGGAGADVLDGGPGVDTVSYEGSDGSVAVDLTTGTALRAHAVGDVLVDIENLEGTRFWDRLTGDGGANRLFGGVGNDRLTGLGGNDVLVGGAGADTLDGGSGADTVSYAGSAASVTVTLVTGMAYGGDAAGDVLVEVENIEGSAYGDRLYGDRDANWLSGGDGVDELNGGGGNDVLEGGAGADVLNGGSGADTVSYAGSPRGVVVNLATDTVYGGDAAGDVLVEVENLEGSAYGDRLYGDRDANWLSGGGGVDELRGGGGNDVLDGGDGADTLDGGSGVDTVSYEGSDGSVAVNLATGTVLRAHGEGDVLVDIENVEGTRYWDRLMGDGGANRLSGGVGNDLLFGFGGNDVLVGGAGADTLDGGSGMDTVSYVGSDGSVVVNLATGTVLRAHGEGDVLVDIENVEGTRYWDRLMGDGGANRLSGGVGNDLLFGFGGHDVLVGGAGADTLDGGSGVDTVSYAGSDGSVVVNLATGTAGRAHADGDVLVDIENVVGSAYGDSLTGDDGANVLEGGAGADRLDGGSGVDTVSYAGSDGSVAVNLATGTVLRAHGEGDVLVDIENVVGSAYGDSLTGDDGANVLEGGAGADRLEGGSGVDTVSYAGSAASVTVNLLTGTASGGDASSDLLVDVENVEGSAHRDWLTGDRGANRLSGGVGNDELSGHDGNDVLVGGADADTLLGGMGADRLVGGAGADTLRGGPGADRLEGGSGADTVSYAGFGEAVTVNLATGTVSGGDAEGDVIDGFENVEGSVHGDMLTGDGGVNWLFGMSGDDTLVGSAGADWLVGGWGADTVSYAGSDAAVAVNLATDTVSGGDAEGDVIDGFENVVGSAYEDVLTGDNGANRLEGGAGADVLNGGSGADILNGGSGVDILDGGSGADTVSYAGSAAAVTVNLATDTVSGGDAEGDVIDGFENVVGSAYEDVLTGDNGANRLEGGAGADMLNGGSGADTVSYAGSAAAVTVNLATDTVSGGDAEGDVIDGFENVVGSAYEDVLTGDNGANRLEGGAGADVLDGGSGVDTVSYAGSAASVTINLARGWMLGGDAEGDEISGFEIVEGSAHRDMLTGDGGANRLFGLGGSDDLRGGGGNDMLVGGLGFDTFHFSYDRGDDIITDFTDGEDRVDLRDFRLSGFDALAISSNSNGVTIDLTAHGGGTILLEGFDIDDLDATDFLF